VLRSLRRHLPVVLTAVIVASVMQVGPPVVAAAYDAVNADKVDGRHAVGAGASAANRAGKLVATNAQGKLPDSIIAKAPDAAKLGGILPDGFLQDVTGAVGSDQVANGSLGRTDLSYAAKMPQAYALVRNDGVVFDTQPAAGITNDNVTSPADTLGVYCIHGLDFAPATVSVSGSLYFSGPSIVLASPGQTTACESVAGTQISVATYAIQNAVATDASFYIQIWG